MNYLIELDTALLLCINSFHSAFGDVFIPIYTEKLTWLPLYVALVYYVIRRWGREAWWIIGAMILCVGLADFVSSSILKPLIERPRPSRVPELEGILHLVNGYRSGRFGFVSSHAANTIGLSLLFGLLSRDRFNTVFLFLWAILNCYSRMYLGVHYPGDILGGAIVGVLMALLVYGVLKKIRPSLLLSGKPLSSCSVFLRYLVSAIWLLTVLCVSIWASCQL